MRRRHEKHDLVGEERADLKRAARRLCRREERDVDVPGFERLDGRAGVLDGERHLQIRQAAPELEQRRGKPVIRGVAFAHDAELRDFGLRRAHAVLEVQPLDEEPLRARGEPLTGRREREPARRSIEEADADLVFGREQRAAHRRLRQMEQTRGLRGAAGGGDGEDDAQVTNVEARGRELLYAFHASSL